MPVTARLSLRFYEKLGEDVANELVDWFNAVDATYRADLRELNELNFARFDARLEQRLVEVRAEMRVGFSQLESRLTERIAATDARLGALETGLNGRLGALESVLIGRIDSRIAVVRTEMHKWVLAAWSSLMLLMLGTLFAVLRAQ